jgi:hypothetical protein
VNRIGSSISRELKATQEDGRFYIKRSSCSIEITYNSEREVDIAIEWHTGFLVMGVNRGALTVSRRRRTSCVNLRRRRMYRTRSVSLNWWPICLREEKRSRSIPAGKRRCFKTEITMGYGMMQ